MPVLQLDDQQFPLNAGATRIGAGADADVIVPGYSAVGVEAVIDGGPTPTIRRADDASHVRVNGVLLGAEPTPLMHGDKVEVAGLELRFSEDSKGGATQFVSASDIAALMGAKRAGSARATAASGGRLVSLVDGKEYSVADAGLVFGRDATSDVVVAQNEVSRRHAEIVPGEQGYVLRDTSANGVHVNGERVQGSVKLARADIVRIGSEEFRFYADVLSTTPATSHAANFAPPPRLPVVPPPAMQADLLDMDLLPAAEPALPVAAPPAAASAPPRLSELPAPGSGTAGPTPPAAASTPVSAPKAKDPRPVIAMLESLNEGPGKGTKYELHTSLGHIGRGAHNDVRLSDESVSETHAKLQKREDGWYVVDMDSTNGTYVGGSRVIGERRIEGAPDVRFGGMKFRFTPGMSSASELEFKGTRAITAMGRPSALAPEQYAAAAPHIPTPAKPSAVAPESARRGVPPWVWIAAIVVIAVVAFFVLQGRA